jgi:hypothetical protein
VQRLEAAEYADLARRALALSDATQIQNLARSPIDPWHHLLQGKS